MFSIPPKPANSTRQNRNIFVGLAALAVAGFFGGQLAVGASV